MKGPFEPVAYVTDFIDHVHALYDLAEYRVAPACLIRIERRVIEQVHVRFDCRCTVRLGGAREADGTAHVGQAVAGLVDDLRSARTFDFEIRVEATALDHKIRDHAVKDSVA